jgi:hypothetical protein
MSALLLKDLQRELQRHLLGESSAIEPEIIDAPPLEVAARLGIYRNAYQVRLIEALHEVYPVLHALLGDEVFYALGESYVAAHPSPFRSIRWYGGQMSEYLSLNAPFDEQPILSEIARLEWILSEVFDSPDAKTLDRAALTSLAPEDWEGLRLGFQPGLRLLTLRFNTAAVWQAMTREEEPPAPQSSEHPVPWIIWRQDFKNYFRSLDAAETALIEAARAGASFAELCEILGDWLPDEEVPLAAANYLNTWVGSGLISALKN